MSESPTLRRALPTAATILLLLSSGCATQAADVPAVPAAIDLELCRPDTLRTVQKGRLTLSTGALTRSPWVVGGSKPGKSADPTGGQGYDAAVGVALAQRLGYSKDAITWRGVPFREAISGGKKDFDVNINQATISPERRAQVDLTAPYYVMRQAVVSVKGRPAGQADRLAELEGVTFAGVEGSVGARVLTEQVDLDRPVVSYPDLDKVRAAVSTGDQAALVVDFTTATQLDVDDSQLVDGELVGLLPRGTETAESYGLVLEKGSSLTPCVSAALDALRADGTLARLEQRWLIEHAGYRLLR